jgi:hypothetical protein
MGSQRGEFSADVIRYLVRGAKVYKTAKQSKPRDAQAIYSRRVHLAVFVNID